MVTIVLEAESIANQAVYRKKSRDDQEFVDVTRPVGSRQFSVQSGMEPLSYEYIADILGQV